VAAVWKLAKPLASEVLQSFVYLAKGNRFCLFEKLLELAGENPFGADESGRAVTEILIAAASARNVQFLSNVCTSLENDPHLSRVDFARIIVTIDEEQCAEMLMNLVFRAFDGRPDPQFLKSLAMRCVDSQRANCLKALVTRSSALREDQEVVASVL
jgi:hypothetical protein